MPGNVIYRRLVEVLRDATTAYDAAPDHKARLQPMLDALRATVTYLLADREVMDNRLAAPLAAMESALADRGQGASPDQLDEAHRGADEVLRPGRPTITTAGIVQGCLAFAAEALVLAGEKPEEAARWVAKRARVKHLKNEQGAEIVAGQIETWRHELNGGRGSPMAREVYRRWRTMKWDRGAFDVRKVLALPRLPDKRQKCEAIAMACINYVAGQHPQSAPAPRLKH